MMQDPSSQAAQEHLVNRAFDAQSGEFDTITTQNPMEVLYRDIVRDHVMQYLRKSDSLLELNCGTGLDAIYFSEQGALVHATDNSLGMLDQLRQKLAKSGAPKSLTVQQCSFHSLSDIKPEKPFRHVFSNFGGLNCSPHIHTVIHQLDHLLETGAMVHLVLIGPICLWEMGAALKGRFSYAFRRFKKQGAVSKIEGNYFTTYYYSASYIQNCFGAHYKRVALKSLGCFLPPTYKSEFPKAWPKTFALLKFLESKTRHLWPFNRIGDLYILTVIKTS
ncbi:MAG TPA: methyltransferase domain-containing protein [Bacteroidia bacterium]|nr:methyltransferase domain-containing protein [Bacteroidia bacterium]